MGALGATGTTAANALARSADVVIGVGTRWSDFTTSSRTAFADPDVRFVSCNITRFDAVKQAGEPLVGDARVVLEQLGEALAGWSVEPSYREESRRLARDGMPRWSGLTNWATGRSRRSPR